jgi:hypothetical protein
MKIKSLIAVCLISLPIMVNAAAITITNHTDSYGTGKINGTCSNFIGDKGVIQPGQELTVPQEIFDSLCFGMTCTAEIYLSKNCRGNKVAVAKIDPSSGIKSIDNKDSAHFTIDYSKTQVTVTQK